MLTDPHSYLSIVDLLSEVVGMLMEIDGAASQPGSSIAGLPATLISATAKVVFAFMDDNSATSNVVFAAITESDLPVVNVYICTNIVYSLNVTQVACMPGAVQWAHVVYLVWVEVAFGILAHICERSLGVDMEAMLTRQQSVYLASYEHTGPKSILERDQVEETRHRVITSWLKFNHCCSPHRSSVNGACYTDYAQNNTQHKRVTHTAPCGFLY